MGGRQKYGPYNYVSLYYIFFAVIHLKLISFLFSSKLLRRWYSEMIFFKWPPFPLPQRNVPQLTYVVCSDGGLIRGRWRDRRSLNSTGLEFNQGWQRRCSRRCLRFRHYDDSVTTSCLLVKLSALFKYVTLSEMKSCFHSRKTAIKFCSKREEIRKRRKTTNSETNDVGRNKLFNFKTCSLFICSYQITFPH